MGELPTTTDSDRVATPFSSRRASVPTRRLSPTLRQNHPTATQANVLLGEKHPLPATPRLSRVKTTGGRGVASVAGGLWDRKIRYRGGHPVWFPSILGSPCDACYGRAIWRFFTADFGGCRRQGVFLPTSYLRFPVQPPSTPSRRPTPTSLTRDTFASVGRPRLAARVDPAAQEQLPHLPIVIQPRTPPTLTRQSEAVAGRGQPRLTLEIHGPDDRDLPATRDLAGASGQFRRGDEDWPRFNGVRDGDESPDCGGCDGMFRTPVLALAQHAVAVADAEHVNLETPIPRRHARRPSPSLGVPLPSVPQATTPRLRLCRASNRGAASQRLAASDRGVGRSPQEAEPSVVKVKRKSIKWVVGVSRRGSGGCRARPRRDRRDPRRAPRLHLPVP